MTTHKDITVKRNKKFVYRPWLTRVIRQLAWAIIRETAKG